MKKTTPIAVIPPVSVFFVPPSAADILSESAVQYRARCLFQKGISTPLRGAAAFGCAAPLPRLWRGDFVPKDKNPYEHKKKCPPKKVPAAIRQLRLPYTPAEGGRHFPERKMRDFLEGRSIVKTATEQSVFHPESLQAAGTTLQKRVPSVSGIHRLFKENLRQHRTKNA